MPWNEMINPVAQYGLAAITAAAFIWFLMRTIEQKDRQHAAEIERLVTRYKAEIEEKDRQLSKIADRFADEIKEHRTVLNELRLALAGGGVR